MRCDGTQEKQAQTQGLDAKRRGSVGDAKSRRRVMDSGVMNGLSVGGCHSGADVMIWTFECCRALWLREYEKMTGGESRRIVAMNRMIFARGEK